MDNIIEKELCDYVQVRHTKLEPASGESSPTSPARAAGSQEQGRTRQRLPSKFYKHWTSLWVVVHVEISPNYSYIGYCKKEADWLADSQTISKCYLDEAFTVQRPASGYSKKYENVLQLIFKGYQLDLGFESVTKLDQWFKALQVTSDRHHVDLVRCHEHPHLEGEYVVQICSSSYVVWSPTLKPCVRAQWEWELKHIRRVHWHKNVNKLEVEPGRSSDTGEGHFYFTGNHAYRLFKKMKRMMSSQMASPLPARQDQQSNGMGRGRGEGSGSESDWTGTGDDWTGTSSDSTFLNYIRSQQQFNPTRSPGISPSPPPPRSLSSPSASSHQEGIYTVLNPNTLNQDNQYCSIDRLQPAPAKSPSLSPAPNRVAPPQPLHSLEALAEDDEYCKMVPGIRAAVLMQQKTSPTPNNRYHPNSPGHASRPPLPPSPITPVHAYASRPSLPSPITPIHMPQVHRHGSVGGMQHRMPQS